MDVQEEVSKDSGRPATVFSFLLKKTSKNSDQMDKPRPSVFSSNHDDDETVLEEESMEVDERVNVTSGVLVEDLQFFREEGSRLAENGLLEVCET